MKRSLNTVRGWDFDRIIPCHGVRILSMLGVSAVHPAERSFPFQGCDREGRKICVRAGLPAILRMMHPSVIVCMGLDSHIFSFSLSFFVM